MFGSVTYKTFFEAASLINAGMRLGDCPAKRTIYLASSPWFIALKSPKFLMNTGECDRLRQNRKLNGCLVGRDKGTGVDLVSFMHDSNPLLFETLSSQNIRQTKPWANERAQTPL